MLNKAMLIGRVGKKDAHNLKNGGEMVNLSIATNRVWTDQQGKRQEQTTWHNVNCFNKLAEIAKKYAHVGNLIYIEGEINHKQITHGEHEGKWAYSLTANQIKLLPSNSKKDSDTSEASAANTKEPALLEDDDLPF